MSRAILAIRATGKYRLPNSEAEAHDGFQGLTMRAVMASQRLVAEVTGGVSSCYRVSESRVGVMYDSGSGWDISLHDLEIVLWMPPHYKNVAMQIADDLTVAFQEYLEEASRSLDEECLTLRVRVEELSASLRQ